MLQVAARFCDGAATLPGIYYTAQHNFYTILLCVDVLVLTRTDVATKHRTCAPYAGFFSQSVRISDIGN